MKVSKHVFPATDEVRYGVVLTEKEALDLRMLLGALSGDNQEQMNDTTFHDLYTQLDDELGERTVEDVNRDHGRLKGIQLYTEE